MTPSPTLGAIAVLVRGAEVLLVQRDKNPDAGLWGFPGGHVELGETGLEAAVRELHEETGLRADPVGYLTNVDVVRRDATGAVTAHYLLATVLCEFRGGTPKAADDARDARWVPQSDLRAGHYPLSQDVLTVLELALQHPHVRRAMARP